MKKMFTILFLYQTLVHAGPFQAPVQTPSLFAKAQQAYLEGDLQLALNTLKPAYTEAANDTNIQKNILQLYKKITSSPEASKINVGWTLPQEIPTMRITVLRRLDKTITYQLLVAGDMNALDELKSFQLLRYPDTMILDKEKKIGRFDDHQKNGSPEFDYRSSSSPFTVTSGLYLLHFKTKSGSDVSGWFMLDDDANSTAQPELFGLDGNPTLNNGSPKISWPDFVSPQYKKEIENRGLNIWVGNVKGEGFWSYWTHDITQKEAIIGSEVESESGWSKGPLENGDYYVLFSFYETRKFGPLKIHRRSATVKYFTVKK